MPTVEVKGLRELGEALKAFPEVIGKKYLRKATFAAATTIKGEVVTRVPVRTGALRDHIAIFKRKSDPSSAAYAVGVRGIKLSRKVKNVLRILRKQNGGARTKIAGDVYYWRFVEFGTAKMSAHPFLRPAFESQKMNAIEVFKASLAAGVDAAAREVRR